MSIDILENSARELNAYQAGRGGETRSENSRLLRELAEGGEVEVDGDWIAFGRGDLDGRGV